MLKFTRIVLAISFAITLTSQAAYRNLVKRIVRESAPTLSRSTVGSLSMPLYNIKAFRSLASIPGNRQTLYQNWQPTSLLLRPQSATSSGLNSYRSLISWNNAAENSSSSRSSLVSVQTRSNYNSGSNSRSKYSGAPRNVLLAAAMTAAGVVIADEKSSLGQKLKSDNELRDLILKNHGTSGLQTIESTLETIDLICSDLTDSTLSYKVDHRYPAYILEIGNSSHLSNDVIQKIYEELSSKLYEGELKIRFAGLTDDRNVILLLSQQSLIENSCYSESTLNQIQKSKSKVYTIPTVILPSAEILKERLIKKGFSHLVEKTNIHEDLGGAKMTPAGVLVRLNFVLEEYYKNMNPKVAVAIDMSKIEIVTCLLQDTPSAIEEIKDLI